MSYYADHTANRVAIEIEANPDDGIVLKDVAGHLPRRGGKKINYSTIWRWATHGCTGIVLETTLIGHCRYTSRQALRRFNRIRNAMISMRPIIAENLRRVPATNAEAKRYLAKEGFLKTPKTSKTSKSKGIEHGHGTESGRLQQAVG